MIYGELRDDCSHLFGIMEQTHTACDRPDSGGYCRHYAGADKLWLRNTISKLLREWTELFHQAEALRDRIATIRIDVDASARTFSSFGFDGYLDAATPRKKREVIFGQGEPSQAPMRDA